MGVGRLYKVHCFDALDIRPSDLYGYKNKTSRKMDWRIVWIQKHKYQYTKIYRFQSMICYHIHITLSRRFLLLLNLSSLCRICNESMEFMFNTIQTLWTAIIMNFLLFIRLMLLSGCICTWKSFEPNMSTNLLCGIYYTLHTCHTHRRLFNYSETKLRQTVCKAVMEKILLWMSNADELKHFAGLSCVTGWRPSSVI